MSSPDQESFIAKVRNSLGHPPNVRRRVEGLFQTAPSPESAARLERIRRRSNAGRRELLETLKAAAEPIHLGVQVFAGAEHVRRDIRRRVETTSPEWGTEKSVAIWRHPLIDRLDLPGALSSSEVSVYRPPESAALPGDRRTFQAWRRQVEKAYIGVTSADFCLADTATLVLRTRPGQDRFVSLVPSIHVAVIELDQLLADLKELYALLRWDPDQQREGLSRYMGFISGPSKTADIEATMVHGAHGPREVHLYVIAGDTQPALKFRRACGPRGCP
jgi:L-lactate dehydrogenase complex protein LldG